MPFFEVSGDAGSAGGAGVCSILDVGCGDGAHTLILSRFFPSASVVGVYISEAAIECAVRNYSGENLSFRVGSAEDLGSGVDGTECLDSGADGAEGLDSGAGAYELVTCFEVLEHVDDWEGVLSGILALEPRYVMVSVPTGKMYDFERRYGHVRHFNGEVDVFLTGRGYRPLRVINAGFPFYRFFYIWLTRFEFLFDVNASIMSAKRGWFQRFYGGVIYFCLRYLSLQEGRGAQYLGLFERDVT